MFLDYARNFVAIVHYSSLQHLHFTARLQEKGPDRNVSIHVCPDTKMDFTSSARNYSFKIMPFSEFIERASSSSNISAVSSSTDQPYFVSPTERYYLRSLGDNPRKTADFFTAYPQLAEDFYLPSFFENLRSKIFSSVFRAGSGNLQLWTHMDITDNILCHLVGRKRVILYPPSQADNLYIPKVPNASSSPVVEVGDPDLVKYPNFVHAQKSSYECILEPGDILYIPALWFHNVLSMEFSVSINIFWKHIAPTFFKNKDPYGNQDLVQGATAIQKAIDADAALTELPEHYQQYYRERVLSILAGKN